MLPAKAPDRWVKGRMPDDARRSGERGFGCTLESVERLDQAIRALTIGHGDPLALLDAAAAMAPEMPMALIAKAWIFAIPLDPKLAVMAYNLADRARTLPMNQRERALLGALDLMFAGQRRASVTHSMRTCWTIRAISSPISSPSTATRCWAALTSSAIVRRGPCRSGHKTHPASRHFAPSKASDWRRPAATPRPRTQRGRPSRSNPISISLTTPSRIAWK